MVKKSNSFYLVFAILLFGAVMYFIIFYVKSYLLEQPHLKQKLNVAMFKVLKKGSKLILADKDINSDSLNEAFGIVEPKLRKILPPNTWLIRRFAILQEKNHSPLEILKFDDNSLIINNDTVFKESVNEYGYSLFYKEIDKNYVFYISKINTFGNNFGQTIHIYWDKVNNKYTFSKNRDS